MGRIFGRIFGFYNFLGFRLGFRLFSSKIVLATCAVYSTAGVGVQDLHYGPVLDDLCRSCGWNFRAFCDFRIILIPGL